MKLAKAVISSHVASVLKFAGHAVVTCVATIAVSTAASAVATDDPRHPEVFAPRFIAAVISKSADQRRSILHPSTQACMNPQTQPYFDWIFSKQFRIVTKLLRKFVVVGQLFDLHLTHFLATHFFKIPVHISPRTQ